MRIYTTNYIKRLRKAFWSVCVAFLVLSSLLFGFVPQRALASNVYTSNITFFKDEKGIVRVQFYVNTGFDVIVGAKQVLDANTDYCRITASGYYFAQNATPPSNPFTIVVPDDYSTNTFTCNRTFHYTAGQTYTNIVIANTFNAILSHSTNKLCIKVNGTANCVFGSYDYISQYGTPTSSSYFQHYNTVGSPWPMYSDTQKYYFTEYPTLTITYPVNNAEIAGNFYITGSFTQPTTPTYAHWLQAIATPAGVLSEYPNAFYWPTNDATSSPFEIWISSLSAGYYDFYIYMKDIVGNFYPDGVSTWKVSNIHIVNDLPFSLPPYAEQPPYTAPPIFETLNPITYYTANSGYATSTALYTTFTDILAPVLLTLGQNLMAYSSNFTPTNASSTGNQIGESIVLIRSYLSNINSFFNNFPVSQFLVLYLIVLLLVVVMRLIKGLIHLFKPV